MTTGGLSKDDVRKTVASLLAANDQQLMMEEPMCVLWRADHKDCIGCPSNLSCAKLIKLIGVLMAVSLYESKSFVDYQVQSKRMEELVKMCVDAKTFDELHKIPMI